MSGRTHAYAIRTIWTGNRGEGTTTYRSYDRTHEYAGHGKPIIPAPADPVFRGDATRYNPEDLLVAALSGCHLLTYLHLCADAGIIVTAYDDDATGTMVETDDGGGHMTEVVLRPRVAIRADSNAELAAQLHERAHHLCFIASSVNFPVRCEPVIRLAPDPA